MACDYKYQEHCRIYKVYIASGNTHYKGELCTGCLWWTKEDTVICPEKHCPQTGCRHKYPHFKTDKCSLPERGNIINGCKPPCQIFNEEYIANDLTERHNHIKKLLIDGDFENGNNANS